MKRWLALLLNYNGSPLESISEQDKLYNRKGQLWASLPASSGGWFIACFGEKTRSLTVLSHLDEEGSCCHVCLFLCFHGCSRSRYISKKTHGKQQLRSRLTHSHSFIPHTHISTVSVTKHAHEQVCQSLLRTLLSLHQCPSSGSFLQIMWRDRAQELLEI